MTVICFLGDLLGIAAASFLGDHFFPDLLLFLSSRAKAALISAFLGTTSAEKSSPDIGVPLAETFKLSTMSKKPPALLVSLLDANSFRDTLSSLATSFSSSKSNAALMGTFFTVALSVPPKRWSHNLAAEPSASIRTLNEISSDTSSFPTDTFARYIPPSNSFV